MPHPVKKLKLGQKHVTHKLAGTGNTGRGIPLSRCIRMSPLHPHMQPHSDTAQPHSHLQNKEIFAYHFTVLLCLHMSHSLTLLMGQRTHTVGEGVPLKFTRGSCSDLAGKGYHVETSCSPPQEHRYTTYRSKCLQFLNKQQRQLFRWNEWLHYYEKQTSLTQGITIKEHESTEGRARG